MYEPPDFTVVPSSRDVVNTKQLIKQIERSLVGDPTPADLGKQLDALKAWIAPVRRLDPDILYIIFELCGEDDPKTTLRISGVSSGWRKVVIYTPRAWAFLNLCQCSHNPTVKLFIERSGQHPLHICFTHLRTRALIANATDRIVCLSIRCFPQSLTGITFPNVKWLRILSYGHALVKLSELETMAFPALRHLICEADLVDDRKGNATSPADIGPLKTLSLYVVNRSAWLRVLQSSRRSLISLQLVYVQEYSSSTKQRIVCPLLKCLEVLYWSFNTDELPVDLKTPALETYWQHSEEEISPGILAHKDIGSVKQLRMAKLPILPPLPKLKLLQAYQKSDLIHQLELLSSNPGMFPELEYFELEMDEDLEDLQSAILSANRQRSQPFQVVRHDKHVDLNGIVTAQECGENIPCQL